VLASALPARERHPDQAVRQAAEFGQGSWKPGSFNAVLSKVKV
jgi:hypothetical protein